MRKYLLIFFLVIAAICEPKLPQITPKDVKLKMEEIFKAHVSYKRFTTELSKRALLNFIDELDPSKVYFIESDIIEWLAPEESLLQKVLDDYKRSNFSLFEQIHQTMLQAISRRSLIEEEIEQMELPKDIDHSEFKDLKWASSKEELTSRLLKIKSLQLAAAHEIHAPESTEQFLQRLQKRRLNHENEIIGENPEETKKLILTYVLKATSSALDTHTNYFTPTEASQFMIQVQQRLFGIGAQLRDNLNGFTIMRILEGGPAALSNKLRINDRIIAVNHEPVVGMDIVEAVELIRGEKGTAVFLTILRDLSEGGIERLEIELIRGEVVLEESRLESLLEPFADGVIAHLKLFSFYQDPNSSSASDITKAIETIRKDHKLKGIILDLRSNSGGLLPQAVAVTGLFITKGVVVSIKDSAGRVQHLREMDGKMLWDGPLFVLTNRASASAAEIVAQTLQDYGRAIVIGDEHTFGKGSFQTLTLDAASNGKVNPQGEFKVTRGRYYTVSGKSPQLIGVPADIVVPGILSELDIGEEFAKYPLENDQIESHFNDDLADIPIIHRDNLARLYLHNLQPKLALYHPFIAPLRKNSQQRIDANKNYQNFLTEIRKKRYDAESVDFFGQSDLQLTECFNIMKDFLFLLQIKDTDDAAIENLAS